MFELLWGLVPQRRVRPLAIIVLIDEDFDVQAEVIKVSIVVGVDFFAFERLHKALATGVVVVVRWPAHAGERLVKEPGR